MDQEPIYVPSDKLRGVCELVLGRIFDIRQTQEQKYMEARVAAYNDAVTTRNQRPWWRFWQKPEPLITPYGMQELVSAELQQLHAVNPEAAQAHPMVEIYKSYGGLEHQAKDAMLQCAINETVAVSSDMVRGISHLGLPLDFMAKPKFGFYPR